MTNAESPPRADGPTAVIDQLLALVDEHYLFPEIASQVRVLVSSQVRVGAYAGLDDAALAAAVTADLQRPNADRHLRLVHHEEAMPEEEDDDARDDAEMAARAQATGHGIGRVERRASGIGVLELTPTLFPPWIAAETVGRAFGELAGSAALVLDLRSCFGGDPEMVAFACTYLFGREAVHLNDIVEQGGRATRQFWTLPYVPGPRFGPERPAYVVTSSATFSGGEELAYDLQQLGRASWSVSPRAAARTHGWGSVSRHTSRRTSRWPAP